MKLTTDVFDRTQRGVAFRAAGTIGEIYLYDEIGPGGYSESAFVENIQALGDVSQINLFINSPGGSVFSGWTMYEILNRHPARINVYIDGHAASMASVLAMAGDRIEMAENAWMMIHWPYDANSDTADDSDKVLEKIAAQIITAYAKRTRLSNRQIEVMMRANGPQGTWMDAKEAVRRGFADAIYAPLAVAACSFDYTGLGFSGPPQPVAVAPQTPPEPSLKDRLIDWGNFVRRGMRA